MASKYAKLKGQIPVAPTVREAAIEALLENHKGKTPAELTTLYNEQVVKAAEIAEKVKDIANLTKALDILIRKALDASEADGITINGFTWSESVEPFPVLKAADVDGVVQFFEENGMEDQLKLTATELAGRLKKHVKEEAQNGELDIEITMVPDPDSPTGEREERIVKSKVPGVTVFLNSKLSRVKSIKGGK